MRRKPYTKYTREFVRFVFQSSQAPKVIAHIHGIDPAYICSIRARRVHSDWTRDLRPRYKAHRLTAELIEEIIRSTESGAELSRRLGFSTATISYVRNGRASDRRPQAAPSTP